MTQSNMMIEENKFHYDDIVKNKKGKSGKVIEIHYYSDGYDSGFIYKVKHRWLTKWYFEWELSK